MLRSFVNLTSRQPEAEQISQKANRVVFYPKPLTAGNTEGFTLPETLAVLYERGSQVLAVAIHGLSLVLQMMGPRALR